MNKKLLFLYIFKIIVIVIFSGFLAFMDIWFFNWQFHVLLGTFIIFGLITEEIGSTTWKERSMYLEAVIERYILHKDQENLNGTKTDE